MNRRLCLLLLTETFHPEIGGGERQTGMLARAFVQRGHEVTVLTRRSRKALPRDEYAGGVRIIRVGPAGLGRWKKWGLVVTALPRLVSLGARSDVIAVSGYRILGVPAVFAARVLGRVCVLKADSAGEMSGEFFRAGLGRFRLEPNSGPVRLVLGARNAVLRRADAFVAMSAAIAGELRGGSVAADQIHMLPNGVDTTRFKPAAGAERVALRKRLGLPGGPIAVYTGRLVSYKGLPLLLRAWRDLRRSGTSGTLVLAGAGGADMHNCEDELREYVAEHGLEDSVVFAGAVDNVEDYLRASDAFVFPTENEAFGVSLIEAMAAGLPSVATPVGAIPDFFVDGANGLVVEPGSFAPLRDAIRVLLAGGDRVAALGRAARETVTARFSEDTIADGYLQVFESSLNRRAARGAS